MQVSESLIYMFQNIYDNNNVMALTPCGVARLW